MTESSLFVATPLHDGSVHHTYMLGALSALRAFPGRIRMDAQIGSWLPASRDFLTARFLESGASHMLCVDSDIGWTGEDAQKLLDTGLDFVSGVYCKKQPDRQVPAEVLSVDGDIAECSHVPAGFLLVSREAVETMVREYPTLGYMSQSTRLAGLWWPATPAEGEDVAFCRKWRALGQRIYMRLDVRLKHAGQLSYEPGEKLNLAWAKPPVAPDISAVA